MVWFFAHDKQGMANITAAVPSSLWFFLKVVTWLPASIAALTGLWMSPFEDFWGFTGATVAPSYWALSNIHFWKSVLLTLVAWFALALVLRAGIVAIRRSGSRAEPG
jgi:hypothetical protein